MFNTSLLPNTSNCNCIYRTVCKLVNNCSRKYRPQFNALLEEYEDPRGVLRTLQELLTRTDPSLLLCVEKRVAFYTSVIYAFVFLFFIFQ